MKHGKGNHWWRSTIAPEIHFIDNTASTGSRRWIAGRLYQLPDGSRYEGDWRHDMKHGEGFYRWGA